MDPRLTTEENTDEWTARRAFDEEWSQRMKSSDHKPMTITETAIFLVALSFSLSLIILSIAAAIVWIW